MPSSNRTCCGFVEEARLRAHDRRYKPQPWIVLKFAVGLTLALIAYTTYVYVGIFCRDMIVKNQSALGSQALGIVFLVIFSILLLLVLWSYISQRPERPGYQLAPEQQSATFDDTRGMSYELLSPTIDPSHHPSALPTSANIVTVTPPAVPAAAKVYQSAHHHQNTHVPGEAHITNVPANPETMCVPDPAAPSSHANSHESSSDPPEPMFPRRPSTTPVLLPEIRYCSKDRIIKPPRTHHCRACGTVRVGHCVGAFNHKFFVNFVQWATILSFWMFATILGLTIKSQSKSPAPGINPQHIVVVALSAFFGIFCCLMFLTHVHLIMLNQTTVESLGFRNMKEREQDNLARMHRCYDFGAKRRTRQRWDKEWGRIDKEGNLWWLGSNRANWESVMGKNVWWWFLPVGHGLEDGLHYPPNPRFDKQGRLMRRREWPSDLR
ncbi:DHHC palmitoyltransferase-domain-containing protein [Suillus paluster]|uniref:DHHC palmitoyltransferase-domain-containing protein n=1 Tax=Suillus paluster TaxID=48578 RepID=UPI001B869EC5|nr:DHHC palmitoyltransferase-domain-containing protein [Suillus paluster]KAG1732653.1 DHHC palmitoyltransferase-domain-containing protein [Suillus paluster]